jgi:hypothetical protein
MRCECAHNHPFVPESDTSGKAGVVEAYALMEKIEHELHLRPTLLDIPPGELSSYQNGSSS